MVSQLLAPEQYTNQKHFLYRFLASDLTMTSTEAILQMRMNKAYLHVGCAAFHHHIALASF